MLPDRSIRWAIRVLAVATVATCAGMAAATFRGDGSSINSFLFLALGLSHEAAATIERTAVGAVLLASVWGAIRPNWMALVPVAGYLLAEAVAGWHQGGYPFSAWSPLARAPAYIVPLCLAFLAHSRADPAVQPGEGRRQVAIWALRLAVSALFLTHGMEAWHQHPRFIDLILTSGETVLGVRLAEADARMLLRAIGVMDVALALAVLVRPWRVLLGWMAIWAALTAVSRMTTHGWGAYPDLLVRASYILAPVALGLLLRSRTKTMPEPPRHDGGLDHD